MASRAEVRLERQQDFCPANLADENTGTRRIDLSGHVQGVGFRPFVYRLAAELGLTGEVCNRLGTVQVIVQGSLSALNAFEHRVISDAPPLARPHIANIETLASPAFNDFRIRSSQADNDAKIFVPPDYFLCADCAAEQDEPTDRRYKYPFINCTQCGPRYTLIEQLPYDRANTCMAAFELCSDCLQEYTEPGDRRFHAEPIACPTCGPQLSFALSGEAASAEREDAMAAALAELRSGRIVAVKGIGGYHLMCDAGNANAVLRLRERKRRPDKPLAVMFPVVGNDGLDAVRRCVSPTVDEEQMLISAARPIVLVSKRDDFSLAENLAPGLAELGVFLPYSPLHHLMLKEFDAPLVATSGNLSGEPVLTDNEQAAIRLSGIADAFLHHDRPIVRPADDPVYRRTAGVLRPLRLGRGVAPLEINLPWQQPEPVLCVGGHMKTTAALSWDNRAVVSPHIGEMDSPRSLDIFEQVLGDLQNLYGVRAERIICDAHSGYATHRWARQQGLLPVTPVWHHHAHASALVGEVNEPGPWLIFAWDGVGLGEDGTLWGGEGLLGVAGNWRRVSSLRPFRPPGGDRAGREPWRSAAALNWDAGLEWHSGNSGYELAKSAWNSDLNCPQTSAAGRLFDAAAAIICGIDKASFEAQGPMLLEALSKNPGAAMALPIYEDDADILRSDWRPLLTLLGNDRRNRVQRAEDFHTSMARIMVDQALAIRARHDVQRIGLVGGVFQNRLLTEQATSMLESAGFQVRLNRLLPCNDAALSFGQAAEWAAQCLQGRD